MDSTSMSYNENGELVSAASPQGTTNYTYDQNGNRTGQIGPVGAISYGFNSNNQMTSYKSSSTSATYSYNRYGTASSTAGFWTTPFEFAGGYRDITELIYLIIRFYNPTTGQFMSADPIVGATERAYFYGAYDPLNYVDPTGTAPWDLIDSVKWGQNDSALGIPKSVANEICKPNELTVFPSGLARASAVVLNFVTGTNPNPTTVLAWLALNEATVSFAWHQVVDKANSAPGRDGVNADSGSMHDQFECHWFFVLGRPNSFTNPTNMGFSRNFHLETWRPHVGLVDTILTECNQL